jgi:hypothetical protein
LIGGRSIAELKDEIGFLQGNLLSLTFGHAVLFKTLEQHGLINTAMYLEAHHEMRKNYEALLECNGKRAAVIH